jgi:hypothetical protein
MCSHVGTQRLRMQMEIIPIEHLIEGEAIETDMKFEMKTVVASEDGKFP